VTHFKERIHYDGAKDEAVVLIVSGARHQRQAEEVAIRPAHCDTPRFSEAGGFLGNPRQSLPWKSDEPFDQPEWAGLSSTTSEETQCLIACCT
jgi:hypothetical protein